MKGTSVVCIPILVSLVLAIVASAGAAPPGQEPTPTPAPVSTQAQAAKAQYRTAFLLYKAKKYDDAIEEFSKVIQLDPGYTMAYRWLAQAYIDKNDSEGALQYFEALLDANPDNGLAYYGIGKVYLDGVKELERTLEYFQKALEVNSKLAIAYNGIGVVFDRQDRDAQAVEMYRKAIATDPSLHLPIQNLIALRSKGRTCEEIIQENGSLFDDNPDSEFAAETQFVVAGCYGVLADYMEQSISEYQKIIDHIPDSYWADNAQAAIGVVYWLLGDYNNTVLVLKKMLDTYPNSDVIGPVHGMLGAAYFMLREFDQAETEWLVVINEYPEVAEEMRVDPLLEGMAKGSAEAAVLVHEAWKLAERGDYRGGLEECEEALSTSQQTGWKTGEADAYNCTGILLLNLGEYEKALESHEMELSIRRELGHEEGEAAALGNIGVVYYQLDDYQMALEYFQRALKIFQAIGSLGSQAKAYADIGALYHAFGEDDKALDYSEKALSIQEAIADRVGEARTLGNIGSIYRALGEDAKASQYYQDALAIHQEVGDTLGEVHAYTNIGLVYSDQEQYGRALEYHRLVLKISEDAGFRKEEASARNNIGTIHNQLRDPQKALQEFEEALEIYREIGDRSGEAKAHANIGIAYSNMNQNKIALQYFIKALELLEAMRSMIAVEELKSSFVEGFEVNVVHRHAVLTSLELGNTVDAFNYAERARARHFLDLLGNRRVDPKASEDRQLLQEEGRLRAELATLHRHLGQQWAKPPDERSQEVIESLTANLEARRQEYEELLTQLQLTNPEYAALTSIDPLTLEEAQTLLQEQAPNATLVSYFLGDEEVVIFVVGPDAFHAEVVAVTREELRAQAEALLAQMKAEPLLPQAWQEPAQALHEWLIAPVQAHLPPPNPDSPPRLGIIPHDLFHYLPFGLLYDGENILLDGYTLFYAPSVSSLEFVFEKRHPEADTLLALANPDVPGAPHLRYAVEEAQAVAALYGTQPFIGSEATESRFKVQAGEYGLVLVAAHSDYNPHSPLFSAILLAGDESEDGRLETHEVFNLDLSETDLVTLSACETHLGELSGGDELVGLERAFFRAGSPSLLTTLWPVDDAATAVLMERFYTHLRAGVSKAEALRLAQMETQTEHSEPYYWAGFVLVGDAGIFSGVTPTPEPPPPEDRGGGGLCGGAAVLLALFGVVGAFGWRRRKGWLGWRGCWVNGWQKSSWYGMDTYQQSR